MKRMTLLFSLLLSPVLLQGPLNAQQRIALTDLTGNRILSLCTSSDIGERDFCHAYIAGIRDGVTWDATIHRSKAMFVIPMNATQDQLKDVVVKYLNEHPETRHKPAGLLVITALSGAFPPENR